MAIQVKNRPAVSRLARLKCDQTSKPGLETSCSRPIARRTGPTTRPRSRKRRWVSWAHETTVPGSTT